MSIHNLCLISASVLVLTNAANATGPKMDISPNFNNHTHNNHTLELKPISQINETYQVAKVTFLPNVSDDLGFSGSQGIGQDHNSGNSCSDFPLTSCPANGNCGQCSFGAFYKLNNCKSGFTKSGNSCTPRFCSSINASYQATVPANNICTKITAYGLTCFKDCRAVSCSGYTINCDAFTIANSASKDTCADCSSADANCSPKLCKVGTCQDGYKLAENATQCVALDDTCSNGYFKTCETGTTGEPQYTELGTACYKCKAKPAVVTTLPILYSDMTISTDILPGKTPIGIVVDSQRKLAVALVENNLAWSTTVFDVPGVRNYNYSVDNWEGKSNTKAIIDYCKSNSKSCPAAEYAYGYSTAGTKPGDWYLPAMEELRPLFAQKDLANYTLNGLGYPVNDTTDWTWYWTSNEYSPELRAAWFVNYINGYGQIMEKSYAQKVRPYLNYGDITPVCISEKEVQTELGKRKYIFRTTATAYPFCQSSWSRPLCEDKTTKIFECSSAPFSGSIEYDNSGNLTTNGAIAWIKSRYCAGANKKSQCLSKYGSVTLDRNATTNLRNDVDGENFSKYIASFSFNDKICDWCLDF